MRRIILYGLASAFLFVCLFANLKESYGNSVEELTPEKLVAAHVKSLGRPALLEKIQSRMFLGASNVEFIQGMKGARKGTSVFVSQGPKVGIIMKYDDNSYPGEYFAYDGKDVTVGYMSPGQRTPIGDFVFRFNKLVKGGFIGGALTSSWPLLDVKNKKVDMKYRKTKIEGRELHELEYHPRSGFGDIKIRMYFDMSTFRHVRTEYKVQSSNDSSLKDESSSEGSSKDTQMNDPADATAVGIGQNPKDSYYTLVEKFEDYKRVGGLMLPHRYMLEYEAEANNTTFIGHWFIDINKWAFNAANLDQKLFRAYK